MCTGNKISYLVAIGVGIILNSFWMLFSFLPSAVLVYFVAIKKEETYLEKNMVQNIYNTKKTCGVGCNAF